MELLEFKKKNFMLRLSRKEAVRLIRTLAAQIDENDPNTNRDECMSGKGFEYFSVTVEPDKNLPPYWSIVETRPLTEKKPKRKPTCNCDWYGTGEGSDKCPVHAGPHWPKFKGKMKRRENEETKRF
jgi:hypothetical protein